MCLRSTHAILPASAARLDPADAGSALVQILK